MAWWFLVYLPCIAFCLTYIVIDTNQLGDEKIKPLVDNIDSAYSSRVKFFIICVLFWPFFIPFSLFALTVNLIVALVKR